MAANEADPVILDRPVMAIPRSAVVTDGLTPVVFRRDPKHPDRVLRIAADVGKDDGRWIEIKSGVRPGDEIVLEGARHLVSATGGGTAPGGHFHADGTFHPAEHD